MRNQPNPLLKQVLEAVTQMRDRQAKTEGLVEVLSTRQGCSMGNHEREIPGKFPFPGKWEGKV